MEHQIKPSGAELLEQETLIRKGIFSTEEAATVLGWPRRQLNLILFRLVQKGRLARIKRGLFCMKPPGTRDLKGYPQNGFVIARALVEDKRYFVSHYSALEIHALTSESIQTIFVSVTRQIHPPKGLHVPIRFVTVPRKRFWGLEEKWVTDQEKVRVSNLERTILDCLDRPDLSGGVMEIARGLWFAKKALNPAKLVRYAKRFGSYAAAKRLGFLMERLGIGSKKNIGELHKFVITSTSYALLDPTRQRTGRYLDRWRLKLNLEPAEIEKNLLT